MRRPIGSRAKYGASEAEYRSSRRLIVHAARAATNQLPPSPSTPMAASCEAPAKTMVEKPTAAQALRPSVAGVAPATSPNGTIPMSMGATAAAPARKSALSTRRMMVAASGHGEPGSRLRSVTVLVQDVRTPALVVDAGAFERNRAAMTAALPGDRLRPHVKAFKSTALARHLAAAGHRGFCGATLRELHGLVDAGLGHDLLLANETFDEPHLREVVAAGGRITVAVDSDETIDVAARAGVGEVLVDVNVGMPRCGCRPEDAGPLAERARRAGLEVRGVMGYEGHLMTAEPASKAALVEASMELLRAAHADVGGDVVSGGGTGTYALNRWCTEIQAGSYLLMDTHYGASEVPFEQALHLLTTVVSVDRSGGWAVADGGLKALGMDHGDPSIDGAKVWFCSDEHTTFGPLDGALLPRVGDRIRIAPAHVDPTVAYHERLHVVSGDEVVDVWPVDLRGW